MNALRYGCLYRLQSSRFDDEIVEALPGICCWEFSNEQLVKSAEP